MKRIWTLVMVAGLALILASGGLVYHNIREEQSAGETSNDILMKMADIMPEQTTTGAENTAPADDAPPAAQPQEYVNPYAQLHEGEETVETLPVVTIDGHDYIGVISMPSIDVELPVLSEFSYDNLKIAPARYYGDIATHDFVICAHNYSTHFGSLRDLNVGDRVLFKDMNGKVYTYEVNFMETLDPMATKDVIAGEWELTLFTCTVGGRTRVIVRCDRV